jgi:hypothetical protein
MKDLKGVIRDKIEKTDLGRKYDIGCAAHRMWG